MNVSLSCDNSSLSPGTLEHTRIMRYSHLNTTTVNQVLGLPGLFSTFTKHELRKLRIIAISASVSSIVACIVGLYLLGSIDRRRKVFRHHLILFLLICDFLKAIVLLIYPVVILRDNKVYGKPGFYNTVGWLTAYATEGADIAIFIFAIHFAILIFKPNWKWKNPNTGNVEGGFYRWRRFMYPLTALTPTVLASLAFINFEDYNQTVIREDSNVILDNNNYHFSFQAKMGGYKPLSAWCYLPPVPVWYKLVLSWGPRYFIFLTICTLYISIYTFVTRQSRKIKAELREFQHSNQKPLLRKASLKGPLNLITRFSVATIRFLRKIAAAIAGFFFLQIYDDNESHEEELDRVKSASRAGTPGPTTKNDLKNVFSNKFTYVPDDVDIEDGYNGDNNNGLHIFNYPRRSETKKATIDNSGITQPLPAHISSSSKNILSPESLSNQVPNLSNKLVNTPINWDLSEPGPKDPSGMETRTFDMDPEKLEHVPEHEVTGVKHKFQTQTYIQFKNRRDQIKRQLKSIFIYPVAYLLLWVFPFAVDCSQYRYEIYHGPIVWLAYIATFMQPLNGVVDVAVFMFREMPWRYSWACIQSKELINTYRLKGELGETVITELASSELGRRGWYYRGRWLREECWKHKPQVWKQACWYVFRFVKGLRKLNFDYEDHCLDRDFWNEYYGTHPDKNFSISTTNKPISDLKHNSSSSSGSTDCEYDPYFKKVKIPILWRIFHFFPLQEGIDLDELDRYLRTKDQLDDFVIPGLENAMNLGKANDNQIFKPNYSLTNNASLNGSQNDKPSSKRSSITAFHYSKSLDLSSIKNMDFSDVTNRSNLPGIGPGVERTNLNSTSSSREQELDLLSFLKD